MSNTYYMFFIIIHLRIKSPSLLSQPSFQSHPNSPLLQFHPSLPPFRKEQPPGTSSTYIITSYTKTRHISPQRYCTRKPSRWSGVTQVNKSQRQARLPLLGTPQEHQATQLSHTCGGPRSDLYRLPDVC